MERIARFSLTTADAAKLAVFYEQAFGCRRIATDRLEGSAFEQLMDVRGGAHRITLGLGAQTMELLQFDSPGRAYPTPSSASDLIFQHFAIVVADMTQAYEHLCSVKGWSAISRNGPQRLPESSGGVTAFKFRDSEGHPLELLAFPESKTPSRWQMHIADLFLGIDHSAISVADAAASIAFYEGLGLQIHTRTYNHGVAQEVLDNLQNVQVDVIALASTRVPPHLELLCYRSAVQHRTITIANNDIAATRLVLRLANASCSDERDPHLRPELDPDGHRLVIAG